MGRMLVWLENEWTKSDFSLSMERLLEMARHGVKETK
jgi:hypothetical protein